GLTKEQVAPATDDAGEAARRKAIATELRQGNPTLAEAKIENPTDQDLAILNHVSRAAALVERLHARQKGTLGLDAGIPAGDTMSRAVFFRNQGPWCVSPLTENDPACSALPNPVPRISGLYPASIQGDLGFCAMLQKQPNASELMGHFSVVEADPTTPGAFRAVPYNVAYRQDMEAVAQELE